MADPDHEHYEIGSMEIGEQRATYDFFTGLTKWGSLIIAVLVLFLTMMFATGAGFFGAGAAATVLAVLGFLALRAKPSDEAH